MVSKIAYTLCSASHLAFAKTMADTLIKHNPDYKVIIGLVDKINNRFDTGFFAPHTIIEIGDMQIPRLDEMSAKYTILELSCAMKPFMAQYLLQQYKPEVLIYTDTDITYHAPLLDVENRLREKDVLVTPHFTTALDNQFFPDEKEFLRSGLYNAGFFAMNNRQGTHDVLNWWGSRMEEFCYLNLAEGLGADQNWLNFVPQYFTTAEVYRNKGVNVAYWNLHERTVTLENGKLMVNGNTPLVFLHLSGYSWQSPDVLSKHQNRYQLKDFPTLATLFYEYATQVKNNKAPEFAGMTCFYAKAPKKPTGIMATINKALKVARLKLIRI